MARSATESAPLLGSLITQANSRLFLRLPDMSDYRDPDGTHLNLFSENAAGEDKIVNAPALTGGFTSWQLPPPNRNEASAAHDSMQHQPPPRYNNNNMSNWGSSNSLGAHMPPQRPAHPGTPRASAGSTPPRSLPLDPEEQFELDLDPDADEQELSANDILRMSGLAKRTSAAPAPSVPPTAPSTDDKPTYTRIPLNKDELALKGKLLADLIAERYGPPDYEGEMYNYSRGPAYGARMYKKGGEGDWRFKVQKNGEEHPESATQFDSRMHAVWKAKQQKEVAAAQKLKEKEEEALRKGIQKASADAKKRKLSKAKGSKKDKRTASDGQSEDDDVSFRRIGADCVSLILPPRRSIYRPSSLARSITSPGLRRNCTSYSVTCSTPRMASSASTTRKRRGDMYVSVHILSVKLLMLRRRCITTFSSVSDP